MIVQLFDYVLTSVLVSIVGVLVCYGGWGSKKKKGRGEVEKVSKNDEGGLERGERLERVGGETSTECLSISVKKDLRIGKND